MVEVLSGEGSGEAYRIGEAEYAVHPLAALFPWIPSEPFEELLADVREHGVQDPVIVWRGQVVDGRNRLRAAAVAELAEVPLVELPESEDPALRIFRANCLRRHLSASRRAALVAKFRRVQRELAADEARERQEARQEGDEAAEQRGDEARRADQPRVQREAVPDASPPAAPAEQAAPAAGVLEPARSSPRDVPFDGPRTPESAELPVVREAAASGVSRQMLARAEALERDAPELSSAVAAGDVTVTDAYSIREQPLAVRKRALKAVRDDKAATLAAAVAEASASRPAASKPKSPSRSPSRSSGDGDDLPPLPGDPGSGGVEASGSPDAELLAPSLVLAGLRVALGTLDLDVCSTPFAQEKVGARDWFSADQDGLNQHWSGTVWAFPPPARADAFASKLGAELTAGRVTAAALLAPARFGTRWARALLEHRAFLCVVVEGRSNPYYLPDGERFTPPESFALYVFGDVQGDLARAFGAWGTILVPAR